MLFSAKCLCMYFTVIFWLVTFCVLQFNIFQQSTMQRRQPNICRKQLWKHRPTSPLMLGLINSPHPLRSNWDATVDRPSLTVSKPLCPSDFYRKSMSRDITCISVSGVLVHMCLQTRRTTAREDNRSVGNTRIENSPNKLLQTSSNLIAYASHRAFIWCA